jgi:hypothetical protein
MMGDPGDCPKSGKREKKGNPKHVKGNVVERRFASTPHILFMGRARSKRENNIRSNIRQRKTRDPAMP